MKNFRMNIDWDRGTVRVVVRKLVMHVNPCQDICSSLNFPSSFTRKMDSYVQSQLILILLAGAAAAVLALCLLYLLTSDTEAPIRYYVKPPGAVESPHESTSSDTLRSDVRSWYS